MPISKKQTGPLIDKAGENWEWKLGMIGALGIISLVGMCLTILVLLWIAQQLNIVLPPPW